MKLEITSSDRDHAILVCDEDHNDIAEFFHSDHATVSQSYETALMLAKALVDAASLIPAEPGECDWPMCGCDPRANKVIDALQENGALGIKTYPDNGSWGHEMPMTKDKIVVLSGPACASCKKMPVPDCDNPACAFHTTRIPAVVGTPTTRRSSDG